MVLLATTPTRTAVIVLSTTAGVMYSTLFTMPYLLVAHYHATQTVSTIVNTTSIFELLTQAVRNERDLIPFL
jgi:hypothetical protein